MRRWRHRWEWDDAGSMRPVVNPWMRKALRGAGPELRGRILAARRELLRGERRARYGPMLVGLGLLIMAFGPGIVRGQGWADSGVYGLSLVALAAAVAGGWWRGAGIGDELIRVVTLGHDLCPSCAGDLAGAVPQAGLVRCAACGARWRERLGRRVASCGACGYDLRGLEAGEDGMVRCPECGVGWRVGEALLGAERAEDGKKGRGGE
ncbi:MAG: hypothetical protein IT431_04980 [Phycisphaerales bacterium]|nr:hypothetical protein [Phycisphaerales bacterium]